MSMRTPLQWGHSSRQSSPTTSTYGSKGTMRRHEGHLIWGGACRFTTLNSSPPGPRVPAMFEWSEEQRMIRDTVRQFVEAEIAPRRDEFEFGDTPPYEVLRKLYRTFGLDVMAREQFKRRLDRADGESGGNLLGGDEDVADPRARANTIAMPMIPIIELCRFS